VLPYTRFCNCLLDYGYVLHIVNFAILYQTESYHPGSVLSKKNKTEPSEIPLGESMPSEVESKVTPRNIEICAL
jgi:hypothetical protein